MGEIITVGSCETDYNFGCRPVDRSIEEYLSYGVINLDKPPGPTSHEVVAWIKKIFGFKKSGHGGTLDPNVSGVLPITLEKTTRLSSILLTSPKEYVALMRVHKKVEEKKLINTLKLFEGEIRQKPPIRSAVRRVLRSRKIYFIKILEIKDQNVLFRVSCQAGTYIRKLCHDIGVRLGCGAQMVELRRIKTGPFKEDSTLVTLHDLKDAYEFWKEDGTEKELRRVVQPMEFAVKEIPKIYVVDGAINAICYGANLAIPGVAKYDTDIKKNCKVAILSLKSELVAIGTALVNATKIGSGKRGICVDIDSVFMKRDTYPRMWKTYSSSTR
jgi:H/ACA ribonucleoprotein complex subunit 4